MNLQELGDLFRQERERQGLTIDEVVEKTKISKINIEGIEGANLGLLPHPVYAKGFVRNYARLLGLDPEQLAEVMAAEYPVDHGENVEEPSGDPNGPAIVSTEAIDAANRRKMNIVILVVAVLLIFAGMGGYAYYSSSKQADDMSAPTQEQVEQTDPVEMSDEAPLPVEEQAEEAETEAEAPVNEMEAVAEAEMEEVAEEQIEAPAVTSEAPAHVAEASAPSETPAEQALAADADGARQRVLITATDVCWLLAKVDGGDEEGGVTVDVTLQPGQAKLLRFNKNMTVKLGNAGGVDLTLNGEVYDFNGKPGQVRTLSFTAE